MNSITLTSNKLVSPILCPTSKSYANRALLWGALREEELVITDLPAAQDVVDMIANLKRLGLNIEQEGSSIKIVGSFPENENNASTDLLGSEGGTTIRFLLTLLSLGKKKYRLPLMAGMKTRPLKDQIECLRGLGAKINRFDDHLEVQGPISLSSSIEVSCKETTQFASSMQLLAAKYDFKLELTDVSFSKHYLEMNSQIIGQNPHQVPADFSGLSYIAAYAWLNQDLTVSNVNGIDSHQGDSILFDMAKDMGAKWKLGEKGLELYQSEFHKGFDCDVSNCLDLFPTLAYMAMFIPHSSRFTGLVRLKDKESDRLAEVLKLYDCFGQNYDLNKDVLNTRPSQLVNSGIEFPLPNDHRVVMAGALMLKQLGGGTINSVKSVDKSFVNFFNIFK